MITPKYDSSKSLISNIMELFKYANFNYREMTIGRVQTNTNKSLQNEADIIIAEQNCTELDIQNIIAEQTITDLDLRVLALEAK